MRRKYTSGKTSISFDNKSADVIEFFAMTDKILAKIAPAFRRSLEIELEAIEREARAGWPVRAKDSQGSAEKFRRGVVFEQSGDKMIVRGYVENYAPYAWAIKASKKREGGPVKPGRRVANELLVKPARKAADRVAEALAEDLLKVQKGS